MTYPADLASRVPLAVELMESFDARGRRYLWTDAYAVGNWLDLGQVARAQALVTAVHHDLAPPGDVDEAHPTARGLRIGKLLPERRVDQAYDERLEWDRDGQYFHYLTRWMMALDRMSGATGDERYRSWARELAQVAADAFIQGDRMVWKMSNDLTRPLVTHMGQHDPLDGFVTALQLGMPALAERFAAIADGMDPTTGDPLGIGGLLGDVARLRELGREALAAQLLAAAEVGLEHWAGRGKPDHPAGGRLAFRELGLAIGVHDARLDAYASVAAHIEEFWSDPGNRRVRTWTDHQDINDVMLATSLIRREK